MRHAPFQPKIRMKRTSLKGPRGDASDIVFAGRYHISAEPAAPSNTPATASWGTVGTQCAELSLDNQCTAHRLSQAERVAVTHPRADLASRASSCHAHPFPRVVDRRGQVDDTTVRLKMSAPSSSHRPPLPAHARFTVLPFRGRALTAHNARPPPCDPRRDIDAPNPVRTSVSPVAGVGMCATSAV